MYLFKRSDIDIFSVHRFDVDGQISYTSFVVTINKEDFQKRAMELIGCFDAWFDEEFLFSGKPLVPTLLLGELKKDAFDLICGSIIIAHSDEEGATCGITIEEANELASFMYENFLKINKASVMGLFGKKTA